MQSAILCVQTATASVATLAQSAKQVPYGGSKVPHALKAQVAQLVEQRTEIRVSVVQIRPSAPPTFFDISSSVAHHRMGEGSL